MKVIEQTSEGATIQLNKKELGLLLQLNLELFGGAFNIPENQWGAVPMVMTRDEAETLFTHFSDLRHSIAASNE